MTVGMQKNNYDVFDNDVSVHSLWFQDLIVKMSRMNPVHA